ncbi:uncharacterized protein [Pyrus communis]|uniref:uncharacterized protein n=1 Tax=Pyrus communis TaxID=23211 RepID=UPI0035BFD111
MKRSHLLTEESTAEQKAKFEKWQKSNRRGLLIMKKAMTETVRAGIPTCDKAKDFLEVIGEKFKESEKAETGNFLTSLTTMKFDGTTSVREHILKMVDTAGKLKQLEVPVSDQFLVHMALNSLPARFRQLKASYNTQKEKWDINDLISICAQEEERQKNEKSEEVNLVHATKGKKVAFSFSSKPIKGSSSAASNVPSKNANPPRGGHNLNVKKTELKACFFCKKTDHLRKNCEG